MKKKILMLAMALALAIPAYAQTTNVSLNYVWNSTTWVPWLATSDGKPMVSLNMFNISGGTANFTGNLTVDTSTFFVDSLNNRVGIGTITPSSTLNLIGAANVIALNVNSTLYVNTTNSTVGIGTASPGARLHVYDTRNVGNYAFPAIFETPSSLGNNFVIFQTTSTAYTWYRTTGKASSWAAGSEAINGDTVFAIAKITNNDSLSTAAGTRDRQFIIDYENFNVGIGMGWGNRPTAKMQINGTGNVLQTNGTTLLATNGGNVGIGTTGPGTLLDVRGDTTIVGKLFVNKTSDWGSISITGQTTNAESAIQFQDTSDTTTTSWLIGKNIATTDDDFVFYYNGARMTIDTSGNVGIGTTGPGQKLAIYDADDPVILSMSSDFVANERTGLNFNLSSSGAKLAAIEAVSPAGNQVDLRFSTWNAALQTDVMTIRYDGNVGIGTTNPAARLHANSSSSGTTVAARIDGLQSIDYTLQVYTKEGGVHMLFNPIDAPNSVIEGALYADTDGILYYKSNTAWAATNAAADFSELILPVNHIINESKVRPGTGLYVGTINANEVIVINDDGYYEASSKAYDAKVAGVESGNRGGFKLEEGSREREEERQRQIGIIGHIKVKATNTNGNINPGDPLVTSNITGTAMKGTIDSFDKVLAVIGKARDSCNQPACVIEIAVGVK